MKLRLPLLVLSLSAVTFGLVTGCDWSSKGTSFNTSKGAGVNINFSGLYVGQIDGKVVARTSAGKIDRLTISQTGNRIEVIDSQGSRYEGTVGAPGVVSSASGGAFPAGAELVQSQINFAGKDEVAQRDIEFVGIIHAVAVTDINGERTVITDGETVQTVDADSSGKTNNPCANEVDAADITVTIDAVPPVLVIGGVQKVTKTTEIGKPGDPCYEFRKEITFYIGDSNISGDPPISEVVPVQSGETIIEVGGPGSQVKTSTSSDTRTETDTKEGATTTTDEFTLTEANVQYRLEGTWIEKDSPIVSRVDALSRGSYGVLTISRNGGQESGVGAGSSSSSGGTTTTTGGGSGTALILF